MSALLKWRQREVDRTLVDLLEQKPAPPPPSGDDVTAPGLEPPLLATPVPTPPTLPDSWSAQSSRAPSRDQSSRAPSRERSLKRMAVTLGLVVVLAAGAVVFLISRGGGGGVALAMSFRQGPTWRYRVHASVDMTMSSGDRAVPVKADAVATVAMKVVSVDPDGAATLAVRVARISATVNGRRVPLPPSQTRQTLRISSDGRVLSGSLPAVGGQGGAGLAPGLNQLAPLLPGDPVRAGDTWSRQTDVPFPLGSGALSLSERLTLVRYQKVHGVRTAVIQDHGTLPLDLTLDVARAAQALGQSAPDLPPGASDQIAYRGAIAFDQTSWFAPGAGRLVSMSCRASIESTISFQGSSQGSTVPDITVSGTILSGPPWCGPRRRVMGPPPPSTRTSMAPFGSQTEESA